jgi:hypothetical protein
MMDYRIKKILIIIGLVSLSAVSCVATPIAGRVSSHSEQISLDGAESVQAQILMGAGKLVVEGGADQLMEGDFTYTYREYAPDIDYRVRLNEVGVLDIKQEDKPGIRVNTNYRNDWVLKFNEDVPLELNITLGAGESDLDLSELNLENFSLQMGAGAAYIDLSGDLDDDLRVNIQGGVGELTVVLPADTNIELDVQSGLGEINTSGLNREGNLYVGKYSGSGPVLYVSIEVGVGQLNLMVQ